MLMLMTLVVEVMRQKRHEDEVVVIAIAIAIRLDMVFGGAYFVLSFIVLIRFEFYLRSILIVSIFALGLA